MASRSLDWSSYPILRFTDLPPLDVVLINRPEIAPLGAGEPATIPLAAAIGNAIFDATGVRLYEGPFTASACSRRYRKPPDALEFYDRRMPRDNEKDSPNSGVPHNDSRLDISRMRKLLT